MFGFWIHCRPSIYIYFLIFIEFSIQTENHIKNQYKEHNVHVNIDKLDLIIHSTVIITFLKVKTNF